MLACLPMWCVDGYRWGEESIVRLLLQSGADGQACDREGATPEMAARVFGSKACVELLQVRGQGGAWCCLLAGVQ